MNQEFRPEIDNHTTKLIVGLIAIMLASLTSLFSADELTSISASYWQPEHWPRNIFVGCLFAIGAFLLSYNGKTVVNQRWSVQMVLSKIAAVAAVCVALFPCNCNCSKVPESCGGVVMPSIVGKIHYFSAAVMFSILAAFCYFFFRDSLKKNWAQARFRSAIYGVCGILIVAAIVLMLYDSFSGNVISNRFKFFTFYAEAVGLVSFGNAWLTASHKLPWINNSEERLPMFPKPTA